MQAKEKAVNQKVQAKLQLVAQKGCIGQKPPIYVHGAAHCLRRGLNVARKGTCGEGKRVPNNKVRLNQKSGENGST